MGDQVSGTTQKQPLSPTGRGQRGDLVLAILAPLLLLLVLEARYPSRLELHHSLGQYFNGVYRTRILGRELILGIGNLFSIVGGTWGRHIGLLPGWLIVNGASFLILSALLYRLTRRYEWGMAIYLTVLASVVLSALVITPYDFPSYALITATVVVAMAGWRGHVAAAAVLAVAAMCARESGFLVVAILLAIRWPRQSGLFGGLRAVVRDRALVVVTLATFVTYTLLHLVLSQHGHIDLLHREPLSRNLRFVTLVDCGIALVIVVVLHAAETLFATAAFRRSRRLLWLFSLPYLAICVIGGTWSEAPRLIMPILIGEVLIACALASGSPDAPAVVRMGAPAGGMAERTNASVLKAG